MTEAEWLAAADPMGPLEFLDGRGDLSPRKHRLFAAACCRRVWHLLVDGRSRAVVEVAERVADGAASRAERLAALEGAGDAAADMPGEGHPPYHAACAAEDLLNCERLGLSDCWWEALRAVGPGGGEGLVQVALVRDIFGNPFRPVAFDPRWQSADAVALAHGIYEDRAFDRLPLLGDALMDAGCDNSDVLDHCRREGPHVRGCWVVDLVLGRE